MVRCLSCLHARSSISHSIPLCMRAAVHLSASSVVAAVRAAEPVPAPNVGPVPAQMWQESHRVNGMARMPRMPRMPQCVRACARRNFDRSFGQALTAANALLGNQLRNAPCRPVRRVRPPIKQTSRQVKYSGDGARRRQSARARRSAARPKGSAPSGSLRSACLMYVRAFCQSPLMYASQAVLKSCVNGTVATRQLAARPGHLARKGVQL